MMGFSYSLNSSDNGMEMLQKIAHDISIFKSFDSPKMNNTAVSVDGSIATFDLRGLNGLINDIPGISPNDDKWQVAIETGWSSDGLSFTQTAYTIGNHPLIGTRTWTVSYDPSVNALAVYTEAYEHPNGLRNDIEFPLIGSDAKNEIWKTYFSNFKSNYLPKISDTTDYSYDKMDYVNPYYQGKMVQ